MLIGATPLRRASSIARSRRWKLSSEYQQRVSSVSSKRWRPARSVKKPRAWLDQAKSGVWLRSNQAFYPGSEAATQPAQTGSTMRARLKLLLTAAIPRSPLSAA